MASRSTLPVVLTIAGSDSGGGAGVQADLATFAALGVHGVCALTCVTAQNPRKVVAVEGCSPSMLRAQLQAVDNHYAIRAAKSGMLLTQSAVREVVRFLDLHPRLTLVVDPVIISSSGAELLKPRALSTLRSELLPRATLVTPNLPEVEVLLGVSIKTPEDLRQSAREMHRRFGVACLVKGGHLTGTARSIDLFYDGETELLLDAPRDRIKGLPGTGCTTSAAVAACLARGESLVESVQSAKEFITQAIHQRRKAGRQWLLNHFWNA